MILWLTLSVSLADEPLSAVDEERARQLFVHGQQLYDQARFDEAAAAFELAYSLSKRPLLLYNMASALERLGRWDDALLALEKYREDSPPKELETLERRIASLRERVDAERQTAAALEAAKNPPPPPKPEKKRLSGGAVVLLSVGAAGLGSGAAFSARALSARGQWIEQCVAGEPRLCPATAADLVQRDKVSSRFADVSWIVGVGGVGGGLLLGLGGTW